MSVGKIIVGAVVLVVAVMAMRMKGLTVSDLLQLAKEEIAHSQAETKAVMSGDVDAMKRQVEKQARQRQAGELP